MQDTDKEPKEIDKGAQNLPTTIGLAKGARKLRWGCETIMPSFRQLGRPNTSNQLILGPRWFQYGINAGGISQLQRPSKRKYLEVIKPQEVC